MSGPAPKRAGMRQRRNKPAGASRLPADGRKGKAPALPERGPAPPCVCDEECAGCGLGECPDCGHELVLRWHPMTVSWWADIWASPMASKWEQADIHGLFRLAFLMEEFFRNPSPSLSAEIRIGQQAYGLSPYDRKRLEWEIERMDQVRKKNPVAAEEQGARSKQQGKKAAADPRELLRVVK